MRANTKGKHGMGRRFAVVIGVAAVGVMALGAPTGAAASEDVVSYGTKLTILKDGRILHGRLRSEGGSKCRVEREVILFRKRPGPDRKLGATRSGSGAGHGPAFFWVVHVKGGRRTTPVGRVYAKATPEVGDGFVCRADKSRVLVDL
jgi:hypothetical protein